MNTSKKAQKHLTTFLRFLERYTGTDMVYLVQGGFWLSVAQLGTSLSGFFLVTILANILPPEKLGEYRFLITGFTLISIFALPGMRTALRESTPKGFRGNLSYSFWIVVRWGVLGSAISLFASAYYFLHENVALAIGFLVIACASPLYNASTVYLEYLTALKKLRHTTVYTIISRAILAMLTAGVAFLFPEYSWMILTAFLFGNIIPNLYFHFKTAREVERGDTNVDRGLTAYAGHITAMTALGLVAGQLDKIFVWKFIGAEGLALFFIAYSIPLAMSQYLLIIPTMAFAKFGEKDPKLIRRTLLSKTLKYMLVIATIVLLYIVVAPYIFSLIFPKYLTAVPYTQALALVVLSSAFLPIKTYLTTLKKTRELYILSAVPPALRIAVAVTLIIPFGLWGAVASLLMEAVVRSVLLLYFFLRTPK